MSHMTETERQNVIDKVQALLAKADSTDFPAEKKAFNDKAAELMAKFAITNSEFAGTAEYYIRDVETVEEEPTTWEIALVNCIAKFNGMLCVIHTSNYPKKHKTLKITGTHSDHSAFNYMYDSVMRQMGTALCSFMTENSHKTNSKYRTEFFLGFAYGLGDKVRDLMDSRNSKIQEYGLVPINEVQKARNWYEQNQGKLSTGKASKASYEMLGVVAGKNASLNKGVSSATHGKITIAM